MQKDADAVQAQAVAGPDGRPDGDGPGGQVQDAPLARATRKRLAAIRADLAARLSTAPPAPAALPEGARAVELLGLHRASGDPAHLQQAKQHLARHPAGTDAALAELAWHGRALVFLHDATGHDLHLDAAERLADALRRREVPRGGFRASRKGPADDLDAAANGAAARFLVELSWRIGSRGGHRDAAEKALRRLCAPAMLDAAPAGWPALLAALDALLADPLHATVTGPWENAGVAKLHQACLRLAADPLVLDWSPANDDFPDAGAPAVYLARGSRCAAPVTDEATLARAAARLLAG